MDDAVYLTAREAAAELNVSRATLYAYVSRGLILSRSMPGRRARLYAAEDVRRLRARKYADPEAPEARALDWGAPVLDSRITLIENGRLYYRGRDAVALARTASLEAVASLLWRTDRDDPFAASAPMSPAWAAPAKPSLASAVAALQYRKGHRTAVDH